MRDLVPVLVGGIPGRSPKLQLIALKHAVFANTLHPGSKTVAILPGGDGHAGLSHSVNSKDVHVVEPHDFLHRNQNPEATRFIERSSRSPIGVQNMLVWCNIWGFGKQFMVNHLGMQHVFYDNC